ncbi:kinase-like protein [Aureobasidium subglaciale]|nr:kinase-like protein [Aureobasidium subglaciale]
MDCIRKQFDQDLLLDGRYQTLSPLNHGSFGMVFLAKNVKTNATVAIKCIAKASGSDTCPAAISVDERSEELDIHSHLGSHPNIVSLLDTFETEHHTYLVIEFCPNGDLYEAIRLNRGPLETEHVRDFMMQLISAVEFMHAKGVYHRDIKPENIFLTQSGSMKLGDFGLATRDQWSTEYAVGSDRYMAPEQFSETSYTTGYSPAAADVWAIGICLLNVLFSRNPFATPTQSDPIFDDFVRDRYSLFDVFPTMSQDTFTVLMQCLAIDPAKRSLAAVRAALESVLSFTTDDDAMDDFCIEERDPIRATLNREPLRTPSITSPTIDNGGCFPWAKALRETSQKHGRQLSVILDNESYTEDLFPEEKETTGKSWFTSTDPDSTSLNSTIESSLGMSYKSANNSAELINHASSRPVPISASVPIKSSRALASVYGNMDANFSKSWSDLWEEDEEEELQHPAFNSAASLERCTTAKPFEPSPLSAVTAAMDIHNASGRSSTPRGLSELKIADEARDVSGAPRPQLIAGVASSAPALQKYSPPSKRSIVDRWSALGNLRRGNKNEADSATKPAPVTPQKKIEKLERPEKYSFPSFGTGTKTSKPRGRAASWRKESPMAANTLAHTGSPAAWERKPQSNPHVLPPHDMWQSTRDWRQHPEPQHFFNSPLSKPRTQPATCGQQLLKSSKPYVDTLDDDDIGDLEWVGGWHDLHL